MKKPKNCTAKGQLLHSGHYEAICNRRVWNEDKQLCIFHSEEKPADEFKNQFLDELKRVNEADPTKELDGRGFVFPEELDLPELSFETIVHFRFARFRGDTIFERAIFKDVAYFPEAVFDGNVSFRECQFLDKVFFATCRFNQKANFEETQFGKQAGFRNTQFNGKVSFNWSLFQGNAFFGKAHFMNEAQFKEVQFENNAGFRESKFYKNVFFGGTSFNGHAHFAKAEFNGLAGFRSTTFEGRAHFEEAMFGNKTYFSGAHFEREAFFVKTQFSSDSYFEGCQFKGPGLFKELVVSGVIYLTDVFFAKDSQVRFERINLRQIRLLGSNIENAKFSLECEWPKVNKRSTAVDEAYSNSLSLSEQRELCISWQLNFENNKRYAEAGDFYIGAMEMRRKQIAKDSSWFGWKWLRQNFGSLIAWYRHVSLYGERLARTFFWMVFVIILFSIFYLLAGFRYQETNPVAGQYNLVNYDLGGTIGTMNLSQLTNDYLRAIELSFYVFTFQRNFPFHLNRASRVFAVVESALSATLLTLFLLVVRRRFKR